MTSSAQCSISQASRDTGLLWTPCPMLRANLCEPRVERPQSPRAVCRPGRSLLSAPRRDCVSLLWACARDDGARRRLADSRWWREQHRRSTRELLPGIGRHHSVEPADRESAGTALFTGHPARSYSEAGAEDRGRALSAGIPQRPRQIQVWAGRIQSGLRVIRTCPWRDEGCRRAGTIHLGGTFNQIASSEWDVARNRHPAEPFVLVSQPTLFDASRAPEGQHTLWAYRHVPKGSTFNMTDRIERQIERFAPGFRDTILARAILNTQDWRRQTQISWKATSTAASPISGSSSPVRI